MTLHWLYLHKPTYQVIWRKYDFISRKSLPVLIRVSVTSSCRCWASFEL